MKDRPVREKKRPNHYDPAKEAAKPQWKKPKKEKENPKHIIFVVGLGASAAGSAGTLRGALRTLWK